MFTLLKTLTLALPIGFFTMQATAAEFDTSKFSQITTVAITGNGSHTVIITDPTRTPGVTIKDDGASSFLCSMGADIQQTDGVLTVDIQKTGISLGFQCDLTVELVLAQAVAVKVDQPLAVLEFTGAFTDVAINVPKVTINLAGTARRFDVKGDMGVVNAVFAVSPQAAPQIDINVAKLVADIGYTEGRGLDYTISAPIAVFSHSYPATKGGQGRLQITSSFLKGSVYPVSVAR
jgi:hypothetical protein